MVLDRRIAPSAADEQQKQRLANGEFEVEDGGVEGEEEEEEEVERK